MERTSLRHAPRRTPGMSSSGPNLFKYALVWAWNAVLRGRMAFLRAPIAHVVGKMAAARQKTRHPQTEFTIIAHAPPFSYNNSADPAELL